MSDRQEQGQAISSIGGLDDLEQEIRRIPLPDNLRADKIRENETEQILQQP